jgi:release factor glutamine methyltransferase
MPVSPEFDPLPATIAALRAAGCVFAEEEARLLLAAAGTPAELADLVRRRAEGRPLEVLLGWAEFCGLRVAVEPGVFVPRRRTEFLVQQAVARARPGCVVLDLCCGSGALGLAVAAAVGRLELHAADIDPVALRCAARNLAPIGALDLMPPEARDHEPRIALDGGPDGVEVHRRVAAGAPPWLAPGGSLLIETGEAQALLTAAAMTAAGLVPHTVHSEEWSCTVVVGTLSVLG